MQTARYGVVWNVALAHDVAGWLTVRCGGNEGKGRTDWLMSGDEIVVLLVSCAMAGAGMTRTTTSRLPGLVRRENPGIGLMRLAVLAALGWIWLVLIRYADPSVTGIYRGFYMVMGVAAVTMFGQAGCRLFGVDARVDVGERRNWPAAVFVAAFTLGTGLVFGGSLWGDADPQGGGEGGWWIPVGFFLLGWGVMASGLALYCWREPGKFRRQLLQERDAGVAWGAASYTLSTAILMTNAVSGDFFGWGSGLKDVGLAAGMLYAHEFLGPARDERQPEEKPKRWIEALVYLGTAALGWGIRMLMSRT